MALPPDIKRVLDALVDGASATLAGDLVGIYVRGSLATGDFIPETSDVDVLVATERPVDDPQFAELAALHADIAQSPNPYANRLEVAYIDRAALRHFAPGVHHPTLGQGESLRWTEHHTNWILERWMVREHGITLLGPDPRTLIDPIPQADLRNAVRDRMPDWVDWANDSDDPEWLQPKRHKNYVIETMCRALYALSTGELTSKPRAVAWAIDALPPEYRDLVLESRAWREDESSAAEVNPDVRRFIRWTAAQAAGV